ncbi:MAG: HYD1 signature containing ADP-ribosyltransferase family protein, partial [Anaerocolumna sp.]
DNYNAITWEDVKSSIPGAVDSFFQPFRTVFNKENAYNFFLNPDATDEQMEEYATNGIAAGLTVYGLGKGVQGITPKISVTNTMRPIINANGTMQLATASAPTISVTAEGGLLGKIVYSAAGSLGGSSYNGSNKGGSQAETLYHYTNENGMNEIIESNQLNPSLKANNSKDARYGNGQYLSDMTPDSKTPSQLAKKFINVPNKYKYTNYVEIDVSGLNLINGRDGVFVIPNELPLDLTGRIVSSGKVGVK